jgi:transcriptional regulator GlxA family with amidase domain
MKRPAADLHMPIAESEARTADTMRSTPDQARSCQLTAVRGVVRGHVVATVRILREHLADPWTLDSLADEAHLSRSQLVRSFDATVGVSPMAYLRQMRVQRMARLLASTDLSIMEAARSVGWTDQNYASRCFHNAYGVSPTEFRHRQAPPPPTG